MITAAAAYDPHAWYWQIPGLAGEVFSSAARALVSTGDSGYVAWVTAGNQPTRIAQGLVGATTSQGFADLFDVLMAQAPEVAGAVAAGWIAAGYLSAAQQAALVEASGVAVISTQTPALDGTYMIDPASQHRIAAISLYIQVNSRFPAGLTSFSWFDAAGVPHSFPTTAEFQSFATALADFVAALDLAAAGAGSVPPQPIAIA